MVATLGLSSSYLHDYPVDLHHFKEEDITTSQLSMHMESMWNGHVPVEQCVLKANQSIDAVVIPAMRLEYLAAEFHNTWMQLEALLAGLGDVAPLGLHPPDASHQSQALSLANLVRLTGSHPVDRRPQS
jgi:hypothetical protein